MRIGCLRLSLVGAVCFAALPALSSNGELEINQACATAPGCFPGDLAGLPVTITAAAGASGYRLTSDLDVSDRSKTAIQISGNDVSLDLGGFRIKGINTCNSSGACTVVGGGSGVTATGSGVAVSHGSVVGMPVHGISLGLRGVVREVRVSENGFTGIATGAGSSVSDSLAVRNGQVGIDAGPGATVVGSTVARCVAYGNGAYGIRAGRGSAISNSSARGNGAQAGGTGAGIDAGPGAVVTGSTAASNTGRGILVGAGGKVSGSAAMLNTAAGIQTGAGSLVTASITSFNDSGLSLGDDSAYRETVVASNTSATVVINGAGTFANLLSNHCTDVTDTVVACP